MFYYSQDTKYAVFVIGVKKVTRKIYLWNLTFHRSQKATSKGANLLLRHIENIGKKNRE